jgi:hypothetical protein
MLEMLMVGVIVLVAAAYSTWALLPATGRRKAATRLLPLAASPACPAWLARRLRSAAAAPDTGSPCDACSGGRPRNDETP